MTTASSDDRESGTEQNAKDAIAAGLAALSTGDLGLAEYHLRRALDVSSSADQLRAAYRGLGAVSERGGKLREAAGLYRAALQFARDAETLVDVAHVEECLGETRQAEDHYSESLVVNPDQPALWSRVGVLRMERGDAEGARGAYQRALALDDALAEAHAGMAEISGMSGDYAVGLAHARRAVNLDPSSALNHDITGRLLLDLHRVAPAVASFREAVRVAPGWVKARVHLAEALMALGQFVEAEQTYRDALDVSPDDSEAWEGLGVLREQAGEYREAECAYRRAMALAPGEESPALLLARLLLFENRAVEAEPLVASMPRAPAELRAALSAARGEWDTAWEALSRVSEDDPADTDAFTVGLAYELLNDPESADRFYRQGAEGQDALCVTRLRHLRGGCSAE